MDDNESKSEDWVDTFYSDLQQLVDSTFPKTCSKCGKVYLNQREFLTETIPVKDINLTDRSGLFSIDEDLGEATVGLFRNCTCGSTLMADFKDRRDHSKQGQERRNRFADLLNRLTEKGMSPADARHELLAVLNGSKSNLLDAFLAKDK
jgi:ribosomal protein S27AE